MTATEYNSDEQVILVNENDEAIGVAGKLIAHEQNLLHRAFSIFIFRENQGRELLIQQRALHKYHSPGLWTNTCCSHPRVGETVLEAAIRRLHQELGLSLSPTALVYKGKFHYNAHFANGLAENEIDHVFTGEIEIDTPIQPNPDEIHAVRWIKIEELKALLTTHPEQFTPWFAKALAKALENS